MVFLKDKYDGSVVYVDLDMTICKQPQSYPCTRSSDEIMKSYEDVADR